MFDKQQIAYALIIIVCVSCAQYGGQAEAAADKCAALNAYCNIHSDCCSLSCLPSLHRCAQPFPRLRRESPAVSHTECAPSFNHCEHDDECCSRICIPNIPQCDRRLAKEAAAAAAAATATTTKPFNLDKEITKCCAFMF